MLERDFQDQVVHLAKLTGWWSFHPLDSRGSEPGWPDLVLLRGPRAVFVELKAEKGRLSDSQVAVLGWLAEAGLDVRIWRPSMLERIADDLGRLRSTQERSNMVGRYIVAETPVEAVSGPGKRGSGDARSAGTQLSIVKGMDVPIEEAPPA